MMLHKSYIFQPSPVPSITTSAGFTSSTSYSAWYPMVAASSPKATLPRNRPPIHFKPLIQELATLCIHLTINILILVGLIKNKHVASWFPYLSLLFIISMCQKSESFKIGKTVPSLQNKMMLHNFSSFQDHPCQTCSSIIWTVLALTITAWHCTLNGQKKISTLSCCKKVFQGLLLLSMLSSATSTMTSQKTLHILKGDDLILECNLLDKLPKAAINWNFSGKPNKPLPERAIITRSQLVIKSVTESLGHISCYASLGIVSWEQRFEISFLSTPEN